MQAAEEENINFKSELGEITSGNPKPKSSDQLGAIKNINNFCDSRQKIINLLNDNARTRSDAIHKTKQDGARLKILTPKQMLQRLPIALAQVKAVSNWENLLNFLFKLFILCINQKKLRKKYTIT